MTSRPNDWGEPMRPALMAPASVAAFQVRYRLANVAPNAARAAARSGWARASAVDSSVTPWAASSRARPRTRSRSARRRLYSAFLLPSRMAPTAPGEQAAAAGDRAGQRELRGAGVGEQAERAGLPDAQPGADRGRAEGQAGDADRQAEQDAVADRPGWARTVALGRRDAGCGAWA